MLDRNINYSQMPEEQVRLPFAESQSIRQEPSTISNLEKGKDYSVCNQSDDQMFTNEIGKFYNLKMRIELSEEQEVERIQKRIRTIFTFYASYGDRLNVNYLKSSKFKRMMMDSQIIDVVPKNKIDLIFYSESHNRSNMGFDNFLNALTKISKALGYNKKGAVEGFHCLIHKYMMPLYEEILKSPNYYTVSILENDVQFDELCNYLIRNVGNVLYEVYSVYFPWEIANSTVFSGLETRSEKSYKEFLKDFDMCPSILTKTLAFQLWNSVMEHPNETYRDICNKI